MPLINAPKCLVKLNHWFYGDIWDSGFFAFRMAIIWEHFFMYHCHFYYWTIVNSIKQKQRNEFGVAMVLQEIVCWFVFSKKFLDENQKNSLEQENIYRPSLIIHHAGYKGKGISQHL